MRVKIHKGIARGRITAPRSKSMAHRLLIAAAFAEGESVIRGISSCEDVLATVDCLRALGVGVEISGDLARVVGRDMRLAEPSEALLCRESGSTMRFLLPIALLSGSRATLVGAERLLARPMTVYEEICKECGLEYSADAGGITVCGPLRSGDFRVRGDISSQFITGLLFALSCLEGDSRIIITTKVESRSYIDLTVSAMASFGVSVEWENSETLYIKGGQRYVPQDITVEGDYSGTAFIDALGLFGGEVKIDGLSEASLQGDRIYRELYPRLASGWASVDIGNCPDLAPILFTVAAAFHGGEFVGTARLKIKESDRAAVMAEELSKFGARLTVEDDRVTVEAVPLHTPCEPLCGHNDHRIVMSLAVLATRYCGEIDGADAISKSYPEFFSDLGALGIIAELKE